MYVVIGAGLAGISAALTLQENGIAVTVLESSDRVGGRVTSDLVDGFTLDRGFQLINCNYPELKKLQVESHLDFKIAPSSVLVSSKDGYLRLADPRKKFSNLFSPRTGSIGSKISFISYLLSTPRAHESVEEHLMRKGVGDLYTKVLRPFLQGVFLTQPAQIGATMGRQIIGTFLNARSGVPAAGVKSLSEFLGAKIEDLRLNTRVEEIIGNQLNTSAGQIQASKIIVATDATTATHLIQVKEVRSLASSITWYHTTEIAPIKSAELIVDSQARGPVVNSIVISNLAPQYAPSGQHLISSTTISHASESDVRRHLALIWGVNTEPWRFLAKYDIPAALPIFGPTSEKLLATKINQYIYQAGDYLSAPSQNGALISGRLAALELMLDEGL